MDVSIIIVNYNTCDLTTQCINSIINTTHDLEYEIIVVDNDSKDRSKDVLSENPNIVFIESGSNLGFGKANNLGVTHSTGEYIFFLNSDTIVLNDAIKQLRDFCEKKETLNIGGVGCLLLNNDLNRIHSYGRYPNAWRYISNVVGDHFFKRLKGKSFQTLDDGAKETSDFFEVEYITGADIFVKRSVIDQYGAFDPDFFMYYEETEMQYRWNKNGLNNYILVGPQIIHLEGGSGKTVVSFGKRMRELDSRLKYYSKTMNRFSYFLSRVFLVPAVSTLLFSGDMDKEQKKQYFKRLLQK